MHEWISHDSVDRKVCTREGERQTNRQINRQRNRQTKAGRKVRSRHASGEK